MRNLRRRIEALERANSANLGRYQAIAERAMGCLQPDDVESLLAAYGAERVGRPLTEREEVAKRSYTEALGRGCQSAGLRPIAGTDLAIAQGVGQVLASRMSLEDLQLCRSGVLAAQHGRQASDPESAAMRTCHSEMERLSLSAGFTSVAEFSAFRRRHEFSEGGDRC